MHPILFHLGPVPVNGYGFLIVVGMLAAATIASLRARAKGIRPEWIWDVAMLALVSGAVGGRLGFVLLERPDLLSHPKEAIAIWHGGMVFYVGFLVATAACLGYLHWRGVSFGAVGDLCAPVIPLGHALARVGCFLAGCCYGKAVSWGVVFPVLEDGVPRHPTQLYEAAGCLALFAVFWALRDRPRRYEGQLLVGYVAAYAVMRFGLEFLRGDDRGVSPFLGLSPSQGVALLALGASGLFHAFAPGRPIDGRGAKGEGGGAKGECNRVSIRL